MKYRIFGIGMTAVMLLAVAVISFYTPENPSRRVHQHLTARGPDEGCGCDGTELCTHLPLVIIDTGGQTIPGEDTGLDDGYGEAIYTLAEDGRDVVDVHISIIDNQDRNNHPSDPAAVETLTEIRLRGHSSRHFEKAPYLLNFVDENGEEYPDNVERAIFYARGVLETVKKLRWCPDVIHCFGWMSAVAPLYIKTAYKDDPPFANAKVSYSAYNEKPSSLSVDDFKRCLSFRSVDDAFLSGLDVDFSSPDVLNRLAVAFSDGLVQAEDGACPDLMDFAAARNLPLLAYPGTDSLAESYGEFYEKVFSESQK